MSVTEQLKRIVAIRNGIRQKLMDFGLVQNTSKFQDCQNAIEGMRDNTKNTTVDNALQSVFHSGTRGGGYERMVSRVIPVSRRWYMCL